MYLDVKVEICCIIVLVSICIHFLELLRPDNGPSLGRNWSTFNKHIHKIVLIVIGDVLDCVNL